MSGPYTHSKDSPDNVMQRAARNPQFIESLEQAAADVEAGNVISDDDNLVEAIKIQHELSSEFGIDDPLLAKALAHPTFKKALKNSLPPREPQDPRMN